MELPKIDIGLLPSLDTVTGMFGSLMSSTQPGSDDTLVIIMVFVYEMFPPETLI